MDVIAEVRYDPIRKIGGLGIDGANSEVFYVYDHHLGANLVVEVSQHAAEEPAECTRWVEKWCGIAANEAKFKTVDFALRETFRRDRIWQVERRGPPEPSQPASAVTAPTAPAVTPPTASAPRPAAPTPPSLPPPNSATRERSGGNQS
jgi:hypothetical protein